MGCHENIRGMVLGGDLRIFGMILGSDPMSTSIVLRTDYWMEEGFNIMQLKDFIQHCKAQKSLDLMGPTLVPCFVDWFLVFFTRKPGVVLGCQG